jgi:broad specificity phosphatase PhoE
MPEGPRRFLGQTDPPLTRRGIGQARELAQQLTDFPLAAVYSSDLERSRRTAVIAAAGRGRQVEERSWLREIDAGLWEMLTFEQAKEFYPQEYAAREHDLAASPFPSGESLSDVEARVVPGFLGLLEEADRTGPGDLLIVGHRAVNVVLLSHLLGRPLASAFGIKQDYCAVSIIETGPAEDGSRCFSVRLSED